MLRILASPSRGAMSHGPLLSGVFAVGGEDALCSSFAKSFFPSCECVLDFVKWLFCVDRDDLLVIMLIAFLT